MFIQKSTPIIQNNIQFKGSAKTQSMPAMKFDTRNINLNTFPNALYSKISFGASNDFQNLSDKKLKLMKMQINEKIEQLKAQGINFGEDIDELDSVITKTNIPLAVKIFSDERLYGNENIREYIWSIINTDSPEETQAKIDILDTFLSDKRLYENESLKNKICDAIWDFDSQPDEDAQAKINLMKAFASDKRLYENESLKNKIGGIVYYADFTGCAQNAIDIMNKIASGEKLEESLEKNLGDYLDRVLLKGY